MAERLTLTQEQAEALQQLRARYKEVSRKSDKKVTEWMTLDDEDTRPHEVLIVP